MSVALTATTIFSPGGSAALLFGGLQKLITYIKYLQLPYSTTLEDMLKSGQNGIFAFDMFPPVPSSWLDYLVSKPIPDIFVGCDLDPSFLVNFWNNLITFVGVIIGWITLRLMIKGIQIWKGPRKLYSFLNFFQLVLVKFLIVQLYSGYGDIAMFSALEIRSVDYKYTTSRISFSLCMIFLILTIFISGFHVWFLLRYQKLKNGQNSGECKKETNAFLEKYSNFEVLYSEFKDESFTQQAYLLFFNLRDAALNIVITTLFGYPLLQSILFVAITSVFLIYIIIKRPLAFLKQNILQIVFELVLFLIYFCTMLLAMDFEWFNSNSLPEVLNKSIVIMTFIYNGGSLLITVVTLLVPLIYAIKRWWIRRKSQKIKYSRKKTRSETLKSDLTSCRSPPMQLEDSIQAKSRQTGLDTSSATINASTSRIKPLGLSQLRANRFKSKWNDLKLENRITNALSTFNDNSLIREELSMPERNIAGTIGPKKPQKGRIARRKKTQKL